METLTPLYTRLLQFGFIALRRASRSGNSEWIEAEIEMLHNVPSLIGEVNLERHRYYWFTERKHYIEWVSAPERGEANSHMRTYYEPIWRDMEPVLLSIKADG